jgi:aminoacyl tRNA synthase complex-interacting multifunctional protein 1
MALKFLVPDVFTERLLNVVYSYGACKDEISIVLDPLKSVEFTTPDGKVLGGETAAVRCLAGQGTRASQLLGNTNEDRCRIAEILSLTRGMSEELLDSQIEAFNKWLERRTFLVGTTVTIADLVLFAHLSKIIADFPVAQHVHYCNVLRWYENIHYLVNGEYLGFPNVGSLVQKGKLALVQEPGKNTKPAVQEKKNANQGLEKPEQAKEVKKKGKRESNNNQGKILNSDGHLKSKPAKKTAATKEDPTVDWLDIRVGKIKTIGPHPNADSLYVEEIDLGEDQPRTVVSGLRKFVTEDAMRGRLVAVVCNLKPAKMRDVMSHGMVLCASSEDHSAVDPIIVPDGSTIGSRIMVDGYSREPEAQINPKKKIFERIAPDMRVDKGMYFYLAVA